MNAAMLTRSQHAPSLPVPVLGTLDGAHNRLAVLFPPEVLPFRNRMDDAARRAIGEASRRARGPPATEDADDAPEVERSEGSGNGGSDSGPANGG